MGDYTSKIYTFATDSYISEGWLGMVSLASGAWDKSRIDNGIGRMLQHHRDDLPTGEIKSAWFEAGVDPGIEGDPGRYKAEVLIPRDTGVAHIENYLKLSESTTLMDSTSVGFMITNLVLTEIGANWMDDKFQAAWEMLEFSVVSVPADVTAMVDRSMARSGMMESGRVPGEYLTMTRGGAGLGYIHKDLALTARALADLKRISRSEKL